jgi:MFS family permease
MSIIFGFAFIMRYLVTSSTPRYLAEWLPPMLLGGIGVGLVLPVLAAASTHSLPPNRFAVGSGVNQAIRQMGSVLGVVAVIGLVDSVQGPGALPSFAPLFLLLGLGGFSTASISAAIDTRPGAPPSPVASLALDAPGESAHRVSRKEFHPHG